MRIVSCNIERGYHPLKTANFLKGLDADIYCLYELDRGVKRTKEVDMFQILKETLNMNSFYVKEFEEIDSVWRKITPWGGAGGGEIGNAIFTKFDVKNYYSIDLPTNKKLEYKGKTWIPELFQPRNGCRKAQVVEINIGSKNLTVLGLHLELWKSSWGDRRIQLESSIKKINLDSTILCGDFNNVSGVFKATILGNQKFVELNKVRDWLNEKKLTDPFSNNDKTCGRSIFKSKIDWICTGKNISVTDKQKINTDISDHSCLVVDFDLL